MFLTHLFWHNPLLYSSPHESYTLGYFEIFRFSITWLSYHATKVSYIFSRIVSQNTLVIHCMKMDFISSNSLEMDHIFKSLADKVNSASFCNTIRVRNEFDNVWVLPYFFLSLKRVAFVGWIVCEKIQYSTIIYFDILLHCIINGQPESIKRLGCVQCTGQ